MTAPTFTSAATNIAGSWVDLTFSADLDGSSIPPTTGFDLQVAGAARAVTGVTRPSARVIRLALSSAVAFGETVTVAYTALTGPMVVVSGNLATARGFLSVPQARGDGTGGTNYGSWAPFGTDSDERRQRLFAGIRYQFRDGASGTPFPAAGFLFGTDPGGTITGPAPPGLQDGEGNRVASFSAQAVTNNVRDPNAPVAPTGPLALGELSLDGVAFVWWNNRSIPVPPRFVADGTAATLRTFRIQTDVQDPQTFETRLGTKIDLWIGSDTSGFEGGPDLLATWEQYAEAIVVTASGETLTIPGPDHAGSNRDSTEPYTWHIDNATLARSDVRAFIAVCRQDGIQATIELVNQAPSVRIAGRLAITGTGSSQLEVIREPVRIAGRLAISGAGESALEVEQPPTRIAGRLPLLGTGESAVAVTQPGPVRLAGRLAISGTGSSAVETEQPPTRIAGRLPLTGTGASALEVAQPPTRIAGRLPLLGTGRSAILVGFLPSRIAGRLALLGAGSSRLEIDQPPSEWEVGIRASSPDWAIMTALEIEHPMVAVPLRVADATVWNADGTPGVVMIEGNEYRCLRFDARRAHDDETRPPQTELSMDDVGEEASQWIEEAEGGAGATCRIIQLPDYPGAEIEWEMTMDVMRVYPKGGRINVRLGFDTGLGRPVVAMRHDPQTSPGLF